jgi:hypothetical protein
VGDEVKEVGCKIHNRAAFTLSVKVLEHSPSQGYAVTDFSTLCFLVSCA